MAYKLFDDLSGKSGIKKKKYNDWEHVEDLKEEFQEAALERKLRMEEYKIIVKKNWDNQMLFIS